MVVCVCFYCDEHSKMGIPLFIEKLLLTKFWMATTCVPLTEIVWLGIDGWSTFYQLVHESQSTLIFGIVNRFTFSFWEGTFGFHFTLVWIFYFIV